MGKWWKFAGLILVAVLSYTRTSAQLSPGDLSSPHAYLEGISNCTKCHVLGNKVSNDKCLGCHKEIGNRIGVQKGYHSSTEVKGKECITCHSDHHGKNFQLVRLDVQKFDHGLTGYSLSVPHSKRECKDCHAAKFITDQSISTKKYTYLGLSTECLSCHADYHQKTLSSACLDCHNPDSFKPAARFNHAKTRFPLLGKHMEVECSRCHKTVVTDGKKFQEFRLTQFSSCVNCHKDPHRNQFGQNCSQCHTEESFQIVKGVRGFDHDRTDYKLEEKHRTVNCKACHKTKFTDPLKFRYCTDCHTDYHNGQFAKNGVSPDCSSCHTVKGFTLFLYTIEQHNQSAFRLQGAHLATPCGDCHRKQTRWSFKGVGLNCKDCHKDKHFRQFEKNGVTDCYSCHDTDNWKASRFDHNQTAFKLDGKHINVACAKCHKPQQEGPDFYVKYKLKEFKCESCHF